MNFNCLPEKHELKTPQQHRIFGDFAGYFHLYKQDGGLLCEVMFAAQERRAKRFFSEESWDILWPLVTFQEWSDFQFCECCYDEDGNPEKDGDT